MKYKVCLDFVMKNKLKKNLLNKQVKLNKNVVEDLIHKLKLSIYPFIAGKEIYIKKNIAYIYYHLIYYWIFMLIEKV